MIDSISLEIMTGRDVNVGSLRALEMVCKRCRKDVGDNEGLQCDFCKGYMHASCGSMTKGLKRELLRAGREKKGVHWYTVLNVAKM